MRFRRRRSIRARLILLIAGISFASLALGFGAVLVRDVSSLREAAREQAVLMTRVVGEYSVGDLAFGDRTAAQESLSKLAVVRGADRAALYDQDGALFAHWGTADVDEEVDPRIAAGVADLPSALRVVEPVVWEGDRYGTLVVVASTGEVDRQIRARLLILGSLVVVLTLLALWMASRWERVISAPLLALARTVREMTWTGRYDQRISSVRQDEIGVLARGIDEMLDQISRREEERDRAESRTQEKSQFLANMSHELRTPLNSIIGFSDILLTRCTQKLDEREMRFLGNIRGSGRHLLEIINDILDLSKIEAGRMDLFPEEVRIEDVVSGTVKLMKPLAEEASVQVDIDLQPGLPSFLADPVKLKQILYNLLSNAIKFSPDGARVVVAADVRAPEESVLGEPSIALSVTDQGIGIAPEDQRAVFQSFRQVDGSTARQFGGTGLGLALVQSFSEMHGGKVELRSVVGEGSTFTVHLPIRTVRDRPLDPAETRPSRILVVEDDPKTCDELRRFLEREGHEVLVAANGDAAIAVARSAQPAAVTLDLVLPGLTDGWDVLRQLKSEESTAEIPILIFSRLENRELGLALGADDYFLKPVDLSRMLRRLDVLVTRRRGQQGGTREEAGPRILVVDDDASLAGVLGPRLETEGYRMIHASTAREALERIEEDPPSLVLLDLLTGDLDGLRVALELRSRPETREVPIILLTGQDPTREDARRIRDEVLRVVEGDVPQGLQGLVNVLDDLLSRRSS